MRSCGLRCVPSLMVKTIEDRFQVVFPPGR